MSFIAFGINKWELGKSQMQKGCEALYPMPIDVKCG
jgi:hypothetical protein